MPQLLLVEDDLPLQKILCDWLAHNDYEVDVAANGLEAWDFMLGKKHDLIVLDWDLPDTTGLDILSRYRLQGGTTPILMLTGRRSIDDKTTGLDAGADDYLTKPFHLKELNSRIKALLRKAERAVPQWIPLGTGNRRILERGDLLGTSLSARYEFLDIVGAGGVGLVFKARHPQLHRLVAVKMVQKESGEPEVLARFEQEARLISKLDHPAIAAVYDYGTTEKGKPFMVLEYVEGMDLGAFIKKEKFLKPELAIDLACQIADGLECAHAAGVVHRDIKPSNVMLKRLSDNKLIAKILDFGCAKQSLLPAQEPTTSIDDVVLIDQAPSITAEGSVVGTPNYMSPEHALGEKVDLRADVYALGCIVYEMLTGHVPFNGNTSRDVLIQHINEQAPPLIEKKPDLIVPNELQAIVSRAMAKEPTQRFESMLEFKIALQSLENPQSTIAGLWKKLKAGITASERKSEK